MGLIEKLGMYGAKTGERMRAGKRYKLEKMKRRKR
jgi:hypothetical protein